MRQWIPVLVLGIVLALGLLGLSPVYVSYVYSESMEPTISEGDGYLVVPAGEITAGDVVTFHSEHRGEHVTHRVVGIEDGGYVTQGDNNDRTDQATGHPLVREEEITGAVLTVGDRPLTIPGLYGVVTAVRTYWPLGALVAGIAVAYSSSERTRDVVRVSDLMDPLFLAIVLGGVIALAVSVPAFTATYAVTETPDDRESTVTAGESAARALELPVGPRPAYTHRILDADGAAVTDHAARGDATTVDLDITGSKPGPHEVTIRLYQYPAIVPYRVVAALHALHPAAAASAVTAAVVSPAYLFHHIIVDNKTPIRTRGSLARRLKR